MKGVVFTNLMNFIDFMNYFVLFQLSSDKYDLARTNRARVFASIPIEQNL